MRCLSSMPTTSSFLEQFHTASNVWLPSTVEDQQNSAEAGGADKNLEWILDILTPQG